jgi:hypothetical protein
MTTTHTWLCNACGYSSTSSIAVRARYCRECGERCRVAPASDILHADAMAKAWDIEQTIRAWGGWARPTVEA